MKSSSFRRIGAVLIAFVAIATLLDLAKVEGQSRNWQKDRRRQVQIEQVNTIDQMMQELWNANSLKPSARAEDYEWCRRIYLDLIGRVPSVAELKDFTSSQSADRFERLVDKLLYDDAYTEEFSRNWTTIWTNLLIGRTGGNGNRSMISRAGMQKYLRDAFARGKPYDRMVYELVTATGTTSPDSDQFNGAVNFLIDKVNQENGTQATAATSKIFLGQQVQCTQCHNHPFNDWKQRKFWEMNAFFRQTRANGGRPATSMGQAAALIDRTYRGESDNVVEADLFYELRNGIIKVAFPVFIDGTEIDKHGDINQVNRRWELARLIGESQYLEKAMVNRTWAHFLGYGFTKPVDDLGPHNPPSFPRLFDYLASEFRASGFDVRLLMKWIVLSRPYALSSRITKDNQDDDPLAGEAPKFSRFYLRQMRAEELYESLLVATRANQNAGSYEEQEQRKNRWLQQFARAFGTDEGDETTSFNGTIPQVLMMFNGELIRQATSDRRSGFIQTLAEDESIEPKEKVHYLFLAGFSRPARKNEMAIAQQLYQARNGNTVQALQDIWWVVLNSNEFIFNH